LFPQLQGGLPCGFAAQGFDFQVGQPALRALARAALDGVALVRVPGA
jgi:hypothetical protein